MQNDWRGMGEEEEENKWRKRAGSDEEEQRKMNRYSKWMKSIASRILC